jgi:protein TonB
MLAYAAGRPRIAERQSSPNALLFVISAHVAVIAVVMSAKMDLPRRILNPPTTIELIRDEPPSPKRTMTSRAPERPTQAAVAQWPKIVPTQDIADRQTQSTQPLPNAGNIGEVVLPPLSPPKLNPPPIPARTGPELLTPPSELKPPYPQSKLLTGEEALLRLRLSIDASGRVIAVDPIGQADSVFLATARRYLITHWRYRPGSDSGHAVPTSVVITLKFQLDD